MSGIRKVAAGEPAVADEGAALLGRYEQLRLDALVGTGQGWRWGRAVLERRGVVAWLAAWTELEVRPAAPVTGEAGAAGTQPGAEQLVAVLAAMALAVTTTTGGCT